MKVIIVAVVLAAAGVGMVLAARAVDLVGMLRRMHGQH
jgi:hypothetical protein